MSIYLETIIYTKTYIWSYIDNFIYFCVIFIDKDIYRILLGYIVLVVHSTVIYLYFIPQEKPY